VFVAGPLNGLYVVSGDNIESSAFKNFFSNIREVGIVRNDQNLGLGPEQENLRGIVTILAASVLLRNGLSRDLSRNL
jgi:hypothetical protein